MLLASFCLRLACGMSVALLFLRANQINPRFYRVQFLTVLGLSALTAWLSWAGWSPYGLLILGVLVLAFAGSFSWSLDKAPGGRILIVLSAAALLAALVLFRVEQPSLVSEAATEGYSAATMPWLVASDITSALLLGIATTAMLMGHSYLIAPAMSIEPLQRLLLAFFLAVGLRLILAVAGLVFWTSSHSLLTLNDVTLWLPIRWGFSFVAPLVLGWMAWQTARIRSTQSATGILYVAVIFCFLGELTSQLLLSYSGYTL